MLTAIVRHVAVPSLEDEVDAVASSADLFNRLAVRHPHRTVPVNLYKLIAHLHFFGSVRLALPPSAPEHKGPCCTHSPL